MLSKLFAFLKPNDEKPSLNQIASSAGIERRRSPRVLYPSCQAPKVLPFILYEDFQVKARDISVGGFCISSNALTDKLSAGEDYEFQLKWDEELIETVRARMIAVSFQKIHFQFLEVTDRAVDKLRLEIDIAQRGAKMKSTFFGLNEEIRTEVKEIWVNEQGDRLVFQAGMDPWVEVSWMNQPVNFFLEQEQDSFPNHWDTHLRTQLLVFLVNIPAPSDELKRLIDRVREPLVTRAIA